MGDDPNRAGGLVQSERSDEVGVSSPSEAVRQEGPPWAACLTQAPWSEGKGMSVPNRSSADGRRGGDLRVLAAEPER